MFAEFVMAVDPLVVVVEWDWYGDPAIVNPFNLFRLPIRSLLVTRYHNKHNGTSSYYFTSLYVYSKTVLESK